MPYYPQLLELKPCINNLEDYAVEVRYVDDWIEIPVNTAKEALLAAEHVKNFIWSLIYSDQEKSKDE